MSKKFLLLTLLALFTMSLAKAQIKQPIMVETSRDTLHPEIYQNWAGYVAHYPRPATELKCVYWGFFSTVEDYDSYLWEVADSTFMPEGGSLTDTTVWCVFEHPGYIKVTVWDELGNSGTDSIWFNIKDWVTPMEEFQMEIDETGHAVFSGVATSEHYYFFVYRSLDTINWYNIGEKRLSPGQWTWRDDEVHFGQDTVWNYKPAYNDTCGLNYYPEMVPGLVMGTQPAPGGGWYLTMKSVLQSNKKEGESRYDGEYVYALYTIDQQGVRHPFEVEGEQVILPTSTQAYLLPGRHPDEYYQGGVGKLTGGKDGGLEILSYSNKVENPLPDLDGLDDNDGGNPNVNGSNFKNLKVWPNPAKTTLNLEGNGQLTVYDATGRRIMDQTLDGKLTLTLPSGMYLVRLVNGTTNETLKVVVE